MEKINQCLTDANQYLTDTDKTVLNYPFVLIILVKYWFTLFSASVIFNQYLTDTKGYILKNNISKIRQVLVEYQFAQFSILVMFNHFV